MSKRPRASETATPDSAFGWFRVNLILPDRRGLMADLAREVYSHGFVIVRLLAGAFGPVASIGLELYGPETGVSGLQKALEQERRRTRLQLAGADLGEIAEIQAVQEVQTWRLRIDAVQRAGLLADIASLLADRANMVFLQTISTGQLHFDPRGVSDRKAVRYAHFEMHLLIVDATTAERIDTDIANRSVAWSIAAHSLRPLYPRA